MINKKILIPNLLIIALAVFSGCGSRIAGGSSQQGNGVAVGKILDKSGNPAAKTRVALFSESYNPVTDFSIPDSCIDTTNSAGEYSVKIPSPTGQYQIVAKNLVDSTAVLISGVKLTGDKTQLGDGQLSVPGSIKILLPQDADLVNGYIFIPGTDIVVRLSTCGTTGWALMPSVPTGQIAVVNYAVVTQSGSQNLRHDIKVSSNDTQTVVNTDWRYKQSLYINTTISGANITKPVLNFPVLVRLTTVNFSFGTAKNTGADIRFTKSDNTLLPYEIARWDSAHGEAEVWVRVDTIYGNDSTHFVNMYWGNPKTSDSSNHAAVFDTSTGLSGVWHLDNTCIDATSNHYDGANFGATDVPGIIGRAKKFNGSDSIRINGLLGSPQAFTISAWVNIDTSAGYGQEVFSIGDDVVLRADENKLSLGLQGSIHHLGPNIKDTFFVNIGSGLLLVNTGWRYIAYSFDKTTKTHSLYVDGASRAITINSDTVDYTGLGNNTFIGAHGNGKMSYASYGTIDEVRFSNVTSSAEWIKLCYMNQKCGDALVQFK